MALAADSPLVYLGDNWYKLMTILLLKFYCRLKAVLLLRFLRKRAQGQIHDGIFAIPAVNV